MAVVAESGRGDKGTDFISNTVEKDMSWERLPFEC